MADDLTIAMRDAGAELAETFSTRGYSGPRTRYGTVTANNGTTLDVALAGGTVPGVPMTTACVGARKGDRVVLTLDGPLVTATGIIATADNGPYVVLYETGARPSVAPVRVSGDGRLDKYAYLEIFGSTSEWRRCYCKVPRVGMAGYDTMNFTLSAYNGNGTSAYIKMSSYTISDTGDWSMTPMEYGEMKTGGAVTAGIGPSIVKVVGWRG